MKIKKNIHKEILKRILVLDGAMGSLIHSRNLSEIDFRGEQFWNSSCDLKGNYDILCITQPHLIKEIHKEYLEAGADIIETNTFNASRISQSDYNLEDFVYQINYEGARIAVEVVESYTIQNPTKPRFVAGAMGPTNKAISLLPSEENSMTTTFDEMYDSYYVQAKGLIDGGVDILMIETIVDIRNAKAAIQAIESIMKDYGKKIPLIISGTLNNNTGRTFSGQTIEEFINSVSQIDLLSIGFNCSNGSGDLLQYIDELSKKAPLNICVYPNAGIPDRYGNYYETPELMAENINVLIKNEIVNIIGGCCGTTPDHIKELVKISEGASIHKVC